MNSITQLVLKMTMPGVPDLYQGTEFWDLSFVDPDNRRPVDFDVRHASLGDIGNPPNWASLASEWQGGGLKLALTRELLTLRNRLPDVFLKGDYRPIEVSGPHRDEILVYAREYAQDAIIVACGRFFARATRGGRFWPSGADYDATVHVSEMQSLDDILNGTTRHSSNGALPIRQLFHNLPVSILHAKVNRLRNKP